MAAEPRRRAGGDADRGVVLMMIAVLAFTVATAVMIGVILTQNAS